MLYDLDPKQVQLNCQLKRRPYIYFFKCVGHVNQIGRTLLCLKTKLMYVENVKTRYFCSEEARDMFGIYCLKK